MKYWSSFRTINDCKLDCSEMFDELSKCSDSDEEIVQVFIYKHIRHDWQITERYVGVGGWKNFPLHLVIRKFGPSFDVFPVVYGVYI